MRRQQQGRARRRRHRRRGALAGVALALLPWAGCAGQPPAEDVARGPGLPPNVIVVITDDQGYGDLGAHGNPVIRTPRLDGLWSQSVRFTDFHVDPTCSPTRAALLTGRDSSRTGVWHTIAGRSLMRTEEVTVPELFQAAGYRTALFGKWHLGDNAPLRPSDQGFDHVFSHGGGGVGQTPDHWGNDYFDDVYRRNGALEPAPGYCTDVWFDDALRFVEDNRARPFLAYVATNAPHSPFRVPEADARPYREAGLGDPLARFYGMITRIDANVGRLLDTLDRLDLARDTILVFLTDNGTAAPGRLPGGEAPYGAGLRGTKGSAYDGGHRVPFFVRWPGGGIGGGRDVDTLAAHVDVLPTLAELAGVPLPEDLALDGRSLVPLLRGSEADWPERTLFVHSQRIETPVRWRRTAVMTERWRLVGGAELYDVEADPGQTRDVAAGHPEVVAALRARYDAWWEGLEPSFAETVRLAVGRPDANPTRITCHDWHGEVVPWHQERVRAAPLVNGHWEIDVTRAGRYRFTLSQRPPRMGFAMGAREATLRVGDAEATAAIDPEAAWVALEVELVAGPARLETRLSGDDGARGAYYVGVEWLEPDAAEGTADVAAASRSRSATAPTP